MLTRQEKVKAIRKELKENGINSKQVSVTSKSVLYDDSINLNIKDLNVNYNLVNNIATKYESISYDQANGEILSGANTYIHVNFNYDAILTEREKYIAKAEEIIKEEQKYSGNESMTVFEKGDLLILFYGEWCSGDLPTIALCKKPEGWENKSCYCLDNIKKYDARCKEGIAEALLMFSCQYGIDVLEAKPAEQTDAKIVKNEESKINEKDNNFKNESTVNANTDIDVTVSFNESKNGIELRFTSKPSQEILSQIKFNGFRWSKFQKIWYAKDTNERRLFLQQIGFLNSNATANNTITVKSMQGKIHYPEIDINDIDTYTVDPDLSKRENNSNWIFRDRKSTR